MSTALACSLPATGMFPNLERKVKERTVPAALKLGGYKHHGDVSGEWMCPVSAPCIDGYRCLDALALT